MTEILPLATVLFAFGSQVCVDRTLLVRLQDDAEDLLAGPQSHGLTDTQTSFVLLARQGGVYITGLPHCSTFIIAGRGSVILTFSSFPTRIDAAI